MMMRGVGTKGGGVCWQQFKAKLRILFGSHEFCIANISPCMNEVYRVEYSCKN